MSYVSIEVCKRYCLSPAHVYIMLAVKESNMEEEKEKMKSCRMPLLSSISGTDTLTPLGEGILDSIVSESKEEVKPIPRSVVLAKEMMELMPSGKKPGSTYYWKGNLRDNSDRLDRFFAYYGDHWSNEEIIEATKKYIEAHRGNQTYMRLLKYFIIKDERKLGGDIVSDLATYLENEDDAAKEDNPWTDELA